jgi:hypothetical protein
MIAIERATLTRVGQRSRQSSHMPRSIGLNPGGPEASDPSERVRAAWRDSSLETSVSEVADVPSGEPRRPHGWPRVRAIFAEFGA